MPRGALMWQENQYYIDVLHEGKIPLTDDDETTYFDKLLTAHEMREKKTETDFECMNLTNAEPLGIENKNFIIGRNIFPDFTLPIRCSFIRRYIVYRTSKCISLKKNM